MMRVEHEVDQSSFNLRWSSTRGRDFARSNERGVLLRARIKTEIQSRWFSRGSDRHSYNMGALIN